VVIDGDIEIAGGISIMANSYVSKSFKELVLPLQAVQRRVSTELRFNPKPKPKTNSNLF
jgi:hypothetical protein